MEELLPFDLPQQQSSIIKVMGVGGGGSNAVNHMYKQGIKDVDFIVCNTDAQALEKSPVPIKIQLGESLTEGRGAGNKPDRGRQAALENIDNVMEAICTNTKMIFITAGMGGGTGTGAAPVIAKATKDLGILTVGIVTLPFRFEGQRRITQAIEGVKELSQHVDSLLVVNNEKLREIYGNLKASEAFSRADDILTVAAKGIAEIITVSGHVNVDFADVQTVMTESGVALMGSAKANGPDRAKRAIQEALSSPLLNNNNIYGAKNILLNIVSGVDEATMDEISEINEFVQEEAGNNADLIWGNTTDLSLADYIQVTVIATGFKTDIIPEILLEKQFSKTEVKKQAENVVFEFDEEKTNNITPKTKTSEEKTFGDMSIKSVFALDEDKNEAIGVKEIEKLTNERVKEFEQHEQQKNKKEKYSGTNYHDKIEELESMPAYLRKKMDLNNKEKPSKTTSNLSNLSLFDDDGTLHFTSNSYLHDKVD